MKFNIRNSYKLIFYLSLVTYYNYFTIVNRSPIMCEVSELYYLIKDSDKVDLYITDSGPLLLSSRSFNTDISKNASSLIYF